MTGPDDDRLRAAVRRSLHDAADSVPRSDALAEHIVATAQAPGVVLRPRFGWRSLALPLVAAASVAALIVGIVLAGRPRADTAAPAHPSGAPVVTVTHTVTPTPGPSAPSSVAATSTPSGGPVPARTEPVDLTFVTPRQGWALGTGLDVGGGGAREPAIVRTTDGGAHWAGVPVPAAVTVPSAASAAASCAGSCVQHLRFANPQVGYLYGPQALYLTTDGGASWQRQTGGALALESLDDNVIRVGSTCPTCAIVVQIADIGSTAWQTVDLPQPVTAPGGVQLVRSGSDAVLLARGDGAAPGTLLVSTDRGATWTAGPVDCPGAGRAVAVAIGSSGRLAVVCSDGGVLSVLIGTVGAAAPRAAPGTVAGGDASVVGVAGPAVLVSGAQLVRSTDGGRTFAAVSGVGPLDFLGFQSDQDGRAIGADGRTVWTTRDGGASWTASTIG